MDLQIIDKRIDTRPLADRLTQGESNADECMIVSERFYGAIDLAALTWEIRGTVRDRNLSMSQVLTPEDSEDQLRLPWKIGPEFLTTSGTLRLTLVGSGANGDVIVKFNGDKLYIKPNDLSGFAPSTSPIEKMWAQMVAALETAKECAQQTTSDAEAAKASEKSAASSAAAALASEQSSATSKQAAENAANEAKEAAQEAVGFRTMQGGAVLPADGDIDLTQPYPTKIGASVTVTSAANRIDSVTVNGFTTQAGTGDASPANVREVKNAGEYTKVLTFDGASAITSVGTNTKGLYRITIKTPEDFEIPDSGVVVDAMCNQLKPVSATAAQFSQTYGYFAAYNGTWWFFVSGDIKDIPSAQECLSKHPIIVAYKSTENTGKFYAGIGVEQNGSYHCDIVELKDRLHSMDKLDTNVQSEFDTELVIAGDEGNISFNSEYNMLNITGTVTAGSLTEDNVYCMVSSNKVPQIVPGQASALTGIFSQPKYSQICIQDSPKKLWTSKESAIQCLKNWNAEGNPLRIFYKSASGGALKNVKREEHKYKTRVLTGTEAMSATTVSEKTYFAIPAPDAKRPGNTTDVLNTKSNMLATSSQSNIILGDYRVCVSTGGNFLIYFNIDVKTVEQAQQILLEKYNAGTPFVIEYELATPEMYADTPVIINNPQGTYTVSGESGTTCQGFMVPLHKDGDAATLNGHSWDDIVSLISEIINSKGE